MKHISRLFRYDDQFFNRMVPEEAMLFDPNMNEDYPIFIKENFLTGAECREIIEQFLSAGIAGQPGANNPEGGVRLAYNFILDGKAQTIYQAAYERATPRIEEFFNVNITGSDGAHGLGYGPGCKYSLHADNCDPVLDSTGKLLNFQATPVTARRQISSLLFLTESTDELTQDYQQIGGNVSFNLLLDDNDEMLLVEPRAGLFIAFPSNPIFSHEVHEVYEVSSDFRLVIVNWHSCHKR